MNTFRKIVMLTFTVLAVLAFQIISGEPGSPARAAAPGRSGRSTTPPDPAPRSIAPYFTRATPGAKAPDGDGFLQRWVLLEPISNSLRTNTGFTETYVRNAFHTEYFPRQFDVVPKDGDKVTVSGEQLAWHAQPSLYLHSTLPAACASAQAPERSEPA